MLSEMSKTELKNGCIDKMHEINARNEHEIFDVEQYKKMMKYATPQDVKEFKEKLEVM